MADTHETIADIIAWLRKPREGENAYLTLWRDEIADRLDAAHKRDAKELRVEIERLKEERNYSGVRERERLRAKGFAIVPKEQLERGDCAKLREALEEARRIASDLGGCRLNDYWKLNEIVRVCDAALAAPPRNCDKYATADEALKAQEQMFNDSNFANGECKLGCPECDNPRVGCKIAWLYAPATEKEGGTR